MKGILRLALVATIVIVGGLALFGCKSKKTKTSPAATRSTASATTVTSGTPSTSGGDASSRLSDLESKLSKKEVKAAYTYTSTVGGTEQKGTFTLYSKPPDWRFDFESGGQTGSIITTGGNSYLCTPDGSGSGTCIQSSSFNSALPFFSFFTDPTSLSSVLGSDVNHSTKKVAGGDADCFSGSVQGSQGELCFNGDGVLVSLSGGNSSTDFKLEATSVEGTVSASDLTPPYPISSIPGVP